MGCLVLIGFCTLPMILALSLATMGGGDYFALAIFFFFIFCGIAQDCLYLLKIQFYQNIDKQYGIFGNILKSHGLCYRYAFRASHDRIDIKI